MIKKLLPFLLLPSFILMTCCTRVDTEYSFVVQDDFWYLWPDTAASWENDKLYLPSEVNLSTIPANPPTGGWEALNKTTGKIITLPSTVEEHFWGKLGLRKYMDNEYVYENYDSSLLNGHYQGVSWWWKDIYIPRAFRGKQVDLFIRGARLRAEIFLNEQLVGYNIINEVSYTCDVSQAIKPGKMNRLAIRITNPGGRMDWQDFNYMQWGDYEFHMSHGFGGLDRGLKIIAHDPVHITDLYVLNTPNLKKAKAHISIKNSSDKALKGNLRYDVIEISSQKICHSFSNDIEIDNNSTLNLIDTIAFEQSKTWSIDNPALYKLIAHIDMDGRDNWKDKKDVNFGFRWFQADGLDVNAVLKINNIRTRLISAISWGFWGYNALFPTKELAEKEILTAKALGLNCLQFHRKVGKTEVFDAQDKLGFYRYMEPGGGWTALGHTNRNQMRLPSTKESVDTTGNNGEPLTFAEKFMEEKIIRMVRDFRQHPSLIMYCIQNEMSPSLNNPRIFHLIRKMQEEDPSRIIVLKSGISVDNQVWVQPYDQTIRYDKGNGYSGWWDMHTVGGEGVWKDHFYQSPESFTHYSDNYKEIVVWGEMLGAATPDNHALMVKQLSVTNTGYDLEDHKKILKGYEDFLNRWKFKQAYKTSEDLFKEIGNKGYDFWGRVIETARLCEANDYLVISGWESTSIENHSGLVDNLRNLKGNPELIKNRLSPLQPVFKPHQLVLEQWDSLSYDIFLLNESHKPHGQKMRLQMIDPKGHTNDIAFFTIPEYKNEQFVYEVSRNKTTAALPFEGEYKFRLNLVEDNVYFDNSVLVIKSSTDSCNFMDTIGVLSDDPEIITGLKKMCGMYAEKYSPKKNYKNILVSSSIDYGHPVKTDSFVEIPGTEDDYLFQTAIKMDYPLPYNSIKLSFNQLPSRYTTVTLRFSNVKPSGNFNVWLNGKKVMHNFNVNEISQDNQPSFVDKTFSVATPNGILKVEMPQRGSILYAIRIESGNKTLAFNCGGDDYTDKNSLTWKSLHCNSLLSEELIKKVEKGTKLLILPNGSEASAEYAKNLASYNIFTYLGDVGNVRASWMGSWFFNRKHPVFKGLPVNCVLGSYYQVNVEGGNGILLEGNNVDVFAGYSRDHDPNVGAACFTANHGKGTILFHCLPGLTDAIKGSSTLINPVVGRKIIINSIHFLETGK